MPELRGGQPDAEGVAHEARHALDLAAQRVVEAVDGGGARLQHRIAEAAHERHRRRAAGRHLRVEPRARARRPRRRLRLGPPSGRAGRSSSSTRELVTARGATADRRRPRSCAPRAPLSAATASTASRTASIAGVALGAPDHELRALAALRAGTAAPGPSTGTPAAAMRSRTASAAASSGPGSGRGADHPDQVAEGRVASASRRSSSPARKPSASCAAAWRSARASGVERLHDHPAAARAAAAAARRAGPPARTCAPRRGSRGSAAWRRRRAPRRA